MKNNNQEHIFEGDAEQGVVKTYRINETTKRNPTSSLAMGPQIRPHISTRALRISARRDINESTGHTVASRMSIPELCHYHHGICN
jgi:hypothetical protein